MSQNKRYYEKPDIHHFLKQEVKRSDGTFGRVYSCVIKKNSENWYCYVCDTKVGGPIEMHNAGRKHKARLELPNHPVELWKKFPDNTKQVVYDFRFMPGEPIPPGFESESAPEAHIQSALNEIEDDGIIGVEYIVELVTQTSSGSSYKYVCMLCELYDKSCDEIIKHLTTDDKHKQCYVEKHFPYTYRFLNSYIINDKYRDNTLITLRKICNAITRRNSRLKPHSAQAELFGQNFKLYKDAIDFGYHFFDTETDNFKHLIDIKFIATEGKRDPSPLSEISSASSIESLNIELEKPEPNTYKFWNNYYTNSRMPAKVFRAHKIGSQLPIKLKSSRSRSQSKSRSRSPNRKNDNLKRSKRSSSRSRRDYSRYSHRRNRSRSFSNSRSRSRSNSRSRGWRPVPVSGHKSPSKSHGWSSRDDALYSSSLRKWDAYGTTSYYRPYAETNAGKVGLLYESSKRAMYEKSLNELFVQMRQVLQSHEENPEDHPLYADEWKQFWNRKYKELQSRNLDPSDYDFKPEWIEFWNLRVHELHEEELQSKCEDLMKKYDIFKNEIDPKTYRLIMQEKSKVIDVVDIADDEKMSAIEDLNSRVNVTEKDINLVGSLRLLCAVDDRLGASIGPRVVNLLSKALSMEKVKANSSEAILDDDEVLVLLETAKEKLKGQLLANLVENQREEYAIKDIVRKIAGLVHFANERKKRKATMIPVKVPGIGVVDKASIASQITTVLLSQGRTDISTNELEKLIETIIGNSENQRKLNSVTFSDADLKMLLQNFNRLSKEEQQRLINYIQTLEETDPTRVQKLKQIVEFPKVMNCADDDDDDYNYDDLFKRIKDNLNKSEIKTTNTSTTPQQIVDTNEVSIVSENIAKPLVQNSNIFLTNFNETKKIIDNIMSDFSSKQNLSNLLALQKTTLLNKTRNKRSCNTNSTSELEGCSGVTEGDNYQTNGESDVKYYPH